MRDKRELTNGPPSPQSHRYAADLRLPLLHRSEYLTSVTPSMWSFKISVHSREHRRDLRGRKPLVNFDPCSYSINSYGGLLRPHWHAEVVVDLMVRRTILPLFAALASPSARWYPAEIDSFLLSSSCPSAPAATPQRTEARTLDPLLWFPPRATQNCWRGYDPSVLDVCLPGSCQGRSPLEGYMKPVRPSTST
jgi:hypothetical protein